ncbi:MAG TPA: hypothetical protein VJI15_00900 [Candidatus Nanoarchaeia archaeon]|nr:hypothetical protein [Candidatus Nanoarchaeia archaeon]
MAERNQENLLRNAIIQVGIEVVHRNLDSNVDHLATVLQENLYHSVGSSRGTFVGSPELSLELEVLQRAGFVDIVAGNPPSYRVNRLGEQFCQEYYGNSE